MHIRNHGNLLIAGPRLTALYKKILLEAIYSPENFGIIDIIYNGNKENALRMVYKMRSAARAGTSSLDAEIGQLAKSPEGLSAMRNIILSVKRSPSNGKQYVYWKRRDCKKPWDTILRELDRQLVNLRTV